MSRCVIVGGAKIEHYDIIRQQLRPDDVMVYCDGGLDHRDGLMRSADLIVGDFDSHENPHADTETLVLPCEKDDTDSVFAVKECVHRGCREFLLIGMIGQRLDHTLGNVYILQLLDELGCRAKILDDYGEMELVSEDPVTIDDTWSYFSLLNITGMADGITIRDAKYPLTNGRIDCSWQYGISNEVLPGKYAQVSVSQGKLLLIKIR